MYIIAHKIYLIWPGEDVSLECIANVYFITAVDGIDRKTHFPNSQIREILSTWPISITCVGRNQYKMNGCEILTHIGLL